MGELMSSKVALNMQSFTILMPTESTFACVTWTTTLVLNSHLSTATRLDLKMITGIPGSLKLSQQLLSMDDGHIRRMLGFGGIYAETSLAFSKALQWSNRNIIINNNDNITVPKTSW